MLNKQTSVSKWVKSFPLFAGKSDANDKFIHLCVFVCVYVYKNEDIHNKRAIILVCMYLCSVHEVQLSDHFICIEKKLCVY